MNFKIIQTIFLEHTKSEDTKHVNTVEHVHLSYWTLLVVIYMSPIWQGF